MKSNETLQKDVQDALAFEPSLHPAEIGVSARDGVVTLTGSVDQYSKKLAAEKATQNVRGVRAVVEKIDVLPAKHVERTDEEIAHDLLHAFKWTWNLPDEKIIAKVEDKWVWLLGTLEYAYQRDTAKEVAAKIPGIKGITNKILLKSEIKDQQTKEKIMAGFSRNWAIDARNVNVKVDHNKVKLYGTVDSLYERLRAARVAWDTPGVTDVENDLEVEFADDIY